MMWDLVQIVWNPGHVLEILILTVGIYYALRFVRGTRGAPVVTGFMVLLFTLVLFTFIFKLRVNRTRVNSRTMKPDRKSTRLNSSHT